MHAVPLAYRRGRGQHSNEAIEPGGRVAVFALVHGGAHGAWCWELLVPELEARGHRTVAPDLPIEDPEAGAVTWAKTVVDALGALDDPVGQDDLVVVGHSLGGMALPVIATMHRVDRLVFLGAMVPMPGQRYVDYIGGHPDAIIFDGTPRPNDEGGEGQLSWRAAFEGFYQDCPEPVARHAWERLRHQEMTVFTEQCPIDRWPDVACTYVLMSEDRAVNPEWSRRVAHERLGADLVELPGSHSPFYSRPAELADVLSRL